MTIHDIRLENLRRLVAEFGTLRNVADLSDVSEGNLRDILRGGKLASGNPKGIGNKLARKLEEGCGKPKGWMDEPEQPTPKPDHPEALVLAPDEQVLVALFRRASPEIRRLIMYAAKLAK